MLRRLLFALAVLAVPLGSLPVSAAAPVLVVYPFAVGGSAPEDIGRQLSAKIAAELTALGGIQVVTGSATTKPPDYRSAARSAGADLYFSGSIVPVGNAFSAIENLVSTKSGTSMWSTLITFRGVDDVRGQGAAVRAELLRNAATPAPASAAAGLELITPPPRSGGVDLPIAGSALDSDRAFATRVIAETLQSRGYKVVPATSSGILAPSANGTAICASSGARTLITGSLDTTRVATLGTAAQTTAHISLQTFDCSAHALDLTPTVVNHIAPIANDAIRGAIEDAISAFPSPS